jgi:TorA maturation chaperone TorD
MSMGNDWQERKSPSQEDAARANLYAVIGRLFIDAPDSILLAELCRADAEPGEHDAPLDRAWQALREACGSAYPVVLKQEYDTLFVGVGKSEVTPYTSHYIAGNSPDRHLVRLRDQLEQLGLARRNAAFQVEDHISGICDVMRFLIEGGRSLPEQALFYNDFVLAGVTPFCKAVQRATSAAFYRRVAEFTLAFLDVEQQAFELHAEDL